MATAKVFQSGNSQSIRIPVEMRTTKKEFFIRRIGEAMILLPTDDPWFLLRDSIGQIPDDFMEDREQPEMQKRDW